MWFVFHDIMRCELVRFIMTNASWSLIILWIFSNTDIMCVHASTRSMDKRKVTRFWLRAARVVFDLTVNMHFVLLEVTIQRFLFDSVCSNFRSQAMFPQFHEFSQTMYVYARVRSGNKRRGHYVSVMDVEVTLVLTLDMKCASAKVKNHRQHTIYASCSYVKFYKLFPYMAAMRDCFLMSQELTDSKAVEQTVISWWLVIVVRLKLYSTYKWYRKLSVIMSWWLLMVNQLKTSFLWNYRPTSDSILHYFLSKKNIYIDIRPSMKSLCKLKI